MTKLTFSQRQGLEPVPRPLGLGDLPHSARNKIYACFLDFLENHKEGLYFFDQDATKIFKSLYVDFFDAPAEKFSKDMSDWSVMLREFINHSKYNKVLDLVEFIIQHKECPSHLIEDLSVAFEKKQIAYRILPREKIIVPRISEEEEGAFDAALAITAQDRFSGANGHLKKAASLLRDNLATDSIRESIHAVESVLKVLSGDDGDDFSAALKKIARVISLHPALKNGFNSIYGYTSDEKGIRHCNILEKNQNVTMDEAIFMLSSCASMISYLINKHDSIEGLKALGSRTS